MNPLDDHFRRGLGDRQPAVPDHLWERLRAARPTTPLAGNELDDLFRMGLAQRTPPADSAIWDRITAARAAPTPPRTGRQLALTALAFLLIGLGLYALQTVDAGEQVDDRTLVGPTSSGQYQDRPGTLGPPPTPGGDPASVPGDDSPLPTLDSKRSAPNSPLPTPNYRLPTPDSRPSTPDSRLPTLDSKLPTLDSRPSTPDSRLPTLDSRLPTLDSRLPTLDSRLPPPPLRLELLAGVGYANQQLGTNGDEANRALREAREISEYGRPALGLEARLVYHAGERLRLLAGLSYTELRNRFEYEREDGATTTLLRERNRIRMLEVPLLLGYELPGNGRLGLRLNAGATLNVYNHVRGRYLDPAALEPRDLGESGFYRNSVGLGLRTSLTTTYALGRRSPYRLLLEPYFRTYPRSFTRADAPVSEKYWTAGLRVGLRRALH